MCRRTDMSPAKCYKDRNLAEPGPAEAQMTVKVLIVDDSDIMRKAIKVFLKNQPEVRLVGEASDLPEAIRKTAELHPDVIVLDLHLTEKNGAIELTALLGAARVLAITFGTDEVSTVLAEHIGAETLIDKMDLTAELVPAILQLALQKRSPSSAFPVGGSPAG